MRVEDVQAFLSYVAGGRSMLGEKNWEIDRADIRAHFAECLESMGPWSMSVGHARWSDEIDHLAEVLERLPRDQMLRSEQGFARAVLEAGVQGPRHDTIEHLEAARVLRLCLRAGVLTRRYCEEVRLAGAGGLTLLGRPLTSLGTVAGLKWLLIVECEQSSGAWDDEWRTSRDLLVELLEGVRPISSPDSGKTAWPFTRRTIARLQDFGVAAVWVDGDEDTEPHLLTVASGAEHVVRSALSDGSWQAAVRAALADEREAVVPSAGRQSAVDAAREQVRLITHEVRNALVPTRHQLDALIRTQALEPERLRKAHEGVLRTLKFVDEMVATTELMAPRRAPIDIEVLMRRVLPLVEDAERVQLSPIRGRVEVDIDRTARAFANIVSNALQAPNVKRVTFTARVHGETALITIDDDGQGVAEEARERIFDDGFTTKPGGSGFGLAYARSAVTASGGSIRCERSDLGGARFVVTLPLVESSS